MGEISKAFVSPFSANSLSFPRKSRIDHKMMSFLKEDGMKKTHFRLIFIIVFTISVILPLKGFAGSSCVLYDNFNSGSINPDLWDVDDSSATITVENGRAKFVMM